MGSESKFYWVDLVGPLMVPTLHSFAPATNAQIDYTFPDPTTTKIMATTYSVSDDLVVQCTFGTSTAYDANQPNQKINTIDDQGEGTCAVEGKDVYFAVASEIRKWTPTIGVTSTVSTAIDVKTQLGATAGDIDAFAVLGDQAVLEETGRLWLASVSSGAMATPLGNDLATGKVDFDSLGVMFDSQNGVEYIDFAHLMSLGFADAIADGGYDLNFKHSDIQNLADGGGYSLQADHAIYRGSGGIFAYGFATKKVVDLLLDRGSDFDVEPLYGDPVVTTDGTLFVQDITEEGGANLHPVYRVDLTGRLR
jgi:hypothetical protein